LARYSVRGIRTGRRQGRQKQSGGLFLSPRENPSHSAKTKILLTTVGRIFALLDPFYNLIIHISFLRKR